jgi:ureidoacrylate peracid hydrolase
LLLFFKKEGLSSLMSPVLSRNVPIDPTHAAVLFVDVQNYNCHRNGGEYAGIDGADMAVRFAYFFDTLERSALPNMRKLLQAARKARIDVLHTYIESQTQDGRDRSLDYKITGFHVAKGSWDAQVLEALAPEADELLFPKTSSSVFISTNIDYVLRNLGTRSLIIAGCLTDQCVDSAVRDACDLGYLVTVPTDACVTQSQERHESALRNNAGYCRQVSTQALIEEIEALTGSAHAARA